MRVLFFGTYDEDAHPRVRVLREGLAANGHDVVEVVAPLRFDTAARVALLANPRRAPLLLARLAGCWAALVRRSRPHRRACARPDVVVVGYLGVLDVHLARMLFRRTTVVLDQLVFLGDTAVDRGAGAASGRVRALRALDRAACRAADLVVVDTVGHADLLPVALRGRAVVVAVGAPTAWLAPAPGARDPAGPLRVVFVGLFTPLQGAPVIGAALARLDPTLAVEVLMVGSGQDLAATRAAVGADARVRWRDWVPAAELPALVATCDVSLGIFGTRPKARRVVPNKAFQGAAAGTVVVTSDTTPQRAAFGGVGEAASGLAAVLVPAGDPVALAAALSELAGDRARVDRLRGAAWEHARARFTPAAVVIPLLERLGPDRR